MSEYQYHHFQKIDRSLTPEERDAVESLSSHAAVTANALTVEYHWGDFKHDPVAVTAAYFDAYYYFASWGTKRLLLRLPADLVDEPTLLSYGELTTEEYPHSGVYFRKAGADWLLDIYFESEDGFEEWMEVLPEQLFELRRDLLTGDLRPFFLAWLGSKQDEFAAYLENEIPELPLDELLPPVPAGLKTLPAHQEAFAAYFAVPDVLIATASEMSRERSPSPKVDVAQLPPAEKDDYLRRLLAEEPQLHLKLRQRLQELAGAGAAKSESPPPITVREFFVTAAATYREQERKKREAKERKSKADLEALGKPEAQVWRAFDSLLAARSTTKYEAAAALLEQLRDYYLASGRSDEWAQRMAEIENRFRRRKAFIRVLEQRKLL
jgi:hypothetical protein